MWTNSVVEPGEQWVHGAGVRNLPSPPHLPIYCNALENTGNAEIFKLRLVSFNL